MQVCFYQSAEFQSVIGTGLYHVKKEKNATGDPFIQTIHYLVFPYIVKKWSTKHKEGLPTLLPQEQAGNFTSSRPL